MQICGNVDNIVYKDFEVKREKGIIRKFNNGLVYIPRVVQKLFGTQFFLLKFENGKIILEPIFLEDPNVLEGDLND